MKYLHTDTGKEPGTWKVSACCSWSGQLVSSVLQLPWQSHAHYNDGHLLSLKLLGELTTSSGCSLCDQTAQATLLSLLLSLLLSPWQLQSQGHGLTRLRSPLLLSKPPRVVLSTGQPLTVLASAPGTAPSAVHNEGTHLPLAAMHSIPSLLRTPRSAPL